MLANVRFFLHEFGTKRALPALLRCLVVRAERNNKPTNGAKDESKDSTFSGAPLSLANERANEAADDGPKKDYLHMRNFVAGSDSTGKTK